MSIYKRTERVSIDVGDGEEWWADIRQVLPQKDYAAAQKLLGTGRMNVATSGNATTQMNFPAYQRELVCRSVVDWNLTDENDQKLAVGSPDENYKSYDLLPQVAIIAIYARVNFLNTPRSAEEKDSFRPEDDGGHPNGTHVESNSLSGVA